MGAGSDNLVEQATHGDREALVALLQCHGPAVRASLAGRIPKRWQAVLSEDDVMQQTYANAVAKIRQFTSGSESSFAGWLETTARRNLRDALKLLQAEKRGGNQRRVQPGGPDDSIMALYEVLSSTGTSPSGCAARDEALTALRRAIQQLPEAYGHVVMLYDLEGRPVEEVAAALKRSPGAVFMLRARAHERLHEIMGRTSNFFSGSS